MPWSDDEIDDREYPDDDEDNGDDETLTRECSRCGADVYEDADQCPRCGAWLTADTSPWKGRAWWWVALGLVGIFVLIIVLALGGL
jgi:ribosomal protein S27AE